MVVADADIFERAEPVGRADGGNGVSIPIVPSQPSPRGGTGPFSRGIGIVGVQGLNSLSTVVQLVLLTLLLPAGPMDRFAVWFTASQLIVGICQSIAAERVLVGRQMRATAESAIKALSLTAAGLGGILAIWLGSLPLVLCSVGLGAFVLYDFHRVLDCFVSWGTFVRIDATILSVQVAAVIALHSTLEDTEFLLAVWWLVGLVGWLVGTRVARQLIDGRPEPSKIGVAEGFRTLRRDARETWPLFVDAVLAGGSLLLVLGLAHAQGAEGTAAASRLALTLLGPVTIILLAGRRIVYRRAAQGPFSRRFEVRWWALSLSVLAVCVGLLFVTMTPQYRSMFADLPELSVWAMAGFAATYATATATFLAAASLRAAGSTKLIGAARIVAILAALVAVVALGPVRSVGLVAACLFASNLAYLVAMQTAYVKSKRLQVRNA